MPFRCCVVRRDAPANDVRWFVVVVVQTVEFRRIDLDVKFGSEVVHICYRFGIARRQDI